MCKKRKYPDSSRTVEAINQAMYNGQYGQVIQPIKQEPGNLSVMSIANESNNYASEDCQSILPIIRERCSSN